MNPLYDLELIESAVLSGEIDDAMNLIRKKEKILSNSINITRNEKTRSHLKVLEAIDNYLQGKSSVDNLGKIISENFVYDVDDKNGFIKNFIYQIYYAVDRYNVKFPEFNGKRCGDL